MHPVEAGAQDRVTAPAGVVQFLTGFAVVAEVREQAGLAIESVGPVAVGAGGVEHDHPHVVVLRPAGVAESALVANWDELAERVVTGIARGAPFLDRLDGQVGSGELAEGDGLAHGARVSPTNRRSSETRTRTGSGPLEGGAVTANRRMPLTRERASTVPTAAPSEHRPGGPNRPAERQPHTSSISAAASRCSSSIALVAPAARAPLRLPHRDTAVARLRP
jgi:hypothetical protein